MALVEQRSYLAAQSRDVALSPALSHQTTTGAQRGVQTTEEEIVVGDPVKGGGRDDRVNRLIQFQLEQIDDADVRCLAEPLSGGLDHRGRLVDCDHATTRQPLDQSLSDPSRPAPSVERQLVAPQLQARQHLEPKRLHRSRDTVVASTVPLAHIRHIHLYVITYKPSWFS